MIAGPCPIFAAIGATPRVPAKCEVCGPGGEVPEIYIGFMEDSVVVDIEAIVVPVSQNHVHGHGAQPGLPIDFGFDAFQPVFAGGGGRTEGMQVLNGVVVPT